MRFARLMRHALLKLLRIDTSLWFVARSFARNLDDYKSSSQPPVKREACMQHSRIWRLDGSRRLLENSAVTSRVRHVLQLLILRR